MGFQAEDVVEKLEWDFRPYVDASGVAPEPTTEQVLHFAETLRDILKAEDDAPVASLSSVLAALSDGDVSGQNEKIVAAFADLCSDQPSAGQIHGLPHRQQQAFLGYIFGQVVNPT
jgi:hypothetical protein